MRRVWMDGHVPVPPLVHDATPHHQARVERDRPVLVDHERVDVELLNPRQFARHRRDLEQHVLHRLLIRRRHVPERLQQPRRPRAADQIGNQERVERRQRHRPVAHDFDRRAA